LRASAGGHEEGGDMSSVWMVAVAAQWVVIALLCVMIIALVQRARELAIRLNGVGIGEGEMGLYTSVPRCEVPVVNGEPFVLGGERERAQLLVFFSPEHGASQMVPAALHELAGEGANIDLLIVPSVPRDRMVEYLRDHGLEGIHATAPEDFPEEYLPNDTLPFAIALTSEGVVAAKGHPRTLGHLREMVAAAQHFADVAARSVVRRHEWGESAPYWEISAA
jgi:hypothetical protein